MSFESISVKADEVIKRDFIDNDNQEDFDNNSDDMEQYSVEDDEEELANEIKELEKEDPNGNDANA
jgi:hypothetical protein